MKVEKINGEKILTISESEFCKMLAKVTGAYVGFHMSLEEEDDLETRMALVEDYGVLTFALKEVLFENGNLHEFFEENSDYTEEEQ